LPPGDPVRLSLRDFAARAVGDATTLTGRRVVLTGFVVHGPDGQPYLARLAVDCCAADARAVKVGLAGDLPATVPPGSWIEVTGRYVTRRDRDPASLVLIPYLIIDRIRPVSEPAVPYES
jgi:uncharacterized repeat protein (TIGR03943 family)